MTTNDTDLILRSLRSLQEDVSEMKGDLKEVKVEAKATNGRLRKLELWRHGMEAVASSRSWRWPAGIAFVSGVGVAATIETLRILTS